ncbi:MAG: DUF1573 domain-containing protein [Chloroflexi bacterium]|nr:DUF1573 domain-containing protein [Chloroflexota bacterium]
MTKPRIRFVSMLLFVATALVLAACATGGTTTPPQKQEQPLQTQKVPVEGGGSYTDVDATGLAAMLKNKDFLLVNVHIPYAGGIEGTDLFIPFDKIEENLDKLPPDKSAKLVVYCRSGGMSAISARALVKLGYTNVWNLDGGMNGWKAAGYTLVSGPKIELPQTKHDFGEVPQGNVVTVTLPVRNVGTADLHIKTVATSCGCTSAKVEPDVIPPQGEGTLTAWYNSGLHPDEGPIWRVVYITTDDPLTPEVKVDIRATVIAP